MLALPDPPKSCASCDSWLGKRRFFTRSVGLYSLKPNQALPSTFPPWLNVFDRNDFLSFIVNPLFPNATDIEVESGQPFPDSHSAYFSNDAVWNAIRNFSE